MLERSLLSFNDFNSSMIIVVDAGLIWPCVHHCVVGVQGSQHLLMREACLWACFAADAKTAANLQAT